MDKKFEEMSFDELKLYRREGLWRSIGILFLIIIVILGMILMEVNHVAVASDNGLSKLSSARLTAV